MRLLEELYKSLLTEAVDLTTPDTILRAIERGQIIGVSKSTFLSGSTSTDSVKATLSTLISVLNDSVSAGDFNKYMMLFFQKAKTAKVLSYFDERGLNEIVDGFKSYFGNINKKEVKEKEEIKQKFDSFSKEALSIEKVKEFEQWANKSFVDKAKMKSGDAQIIYNKDGWQVIVPKTFAAAKEYACMNNRKAQWCTSASSSHYDYYTNDGTDNIYIIRSEKRDKMFQMDFGNKDKKMPNFKNESDGTATIPELKKAGVPDDLLTFLKNKEGKSIKDSIDDFKKRSDKVNRKISLSNKSIGSEWTNKRFPNLPSFRKAFLTDTGSYYMSFVDSIEFPDGVNNREERNSNKRGNLERALSGGIDKKIIFGRIQKEDKIYYYIVPSVGLVGYYPEDGPIEIEENLLISVSKQKEGSVIEIVPNKSFASIELPNVVKSLLLNKKLRTKENKETEYKKEKSETTKIGSDWSKQETIIKDINSLNTIFNADIDERSLIRLKKILEGVSIKTLAFIILKNFEINVYFKDGTMKSMGNSYSGKKIKLFNYSKEMRMEILSQMKKYNISNINSLQDNVVRAIYEFENEAVLKRYKNFEVYFDPKPELSTGLPISYFKVRGIGDYKVSETLKTVNVESFANEERNEGIADELRNLVRPYYSIMHFFNSKKDKEMFFSNIKQFERGRAR